jgi:alkanesulfonate monooxygenase SsuD/methylene tetrahydromethanopterin reductase-like flavin-dependent oxidoreductase (luciferase family)
MAATLDHVSDGRLNLGLGAGWFELEHRSFGIDFKTIPGRLQALDESLQIIKGMFEQEKMTLRGRHYNVTDAVCNPKPLQKPHPPIMIGGQGQKVLLKIVAKHADMWNVPNASAERYADLLKVIERHGDAVGRDTDQIEKTIMMGLTYRAPAEREKAALGRIMAISGATPDQARRQMMIGSREECLETIDRYIKVGVTHFIFTLPRPFYLDEVQRFAEEVIPAVRSK